MVPAPKPYDHKHAEMLRAYITDRERQGYTLHGTEVPYGSNTVRSFVDAVLYKTTPDSTRTDWIVAELKTSLADIGRSIRQVKAARHFFFPYHSQLTRERPPRALHFPLVIWANEDDLRRCVQYHKLIADIDVQFFHTTRQVAIDIANKFEIHKAILAVKAGHIPPSSSPSSSTRSQVLPPLSANTQP